MGDGEGNVINRFDWNELMRIGIPFQIKFSWTSSATASYFTLDSNNYDDDGDGTNETTPFIDRALIITGAKVVVGASATLADFIIDDKSVYADLVGASTLYLSGQVETSPGVLAGNVAQKYGRPLVCNYRFGGMHSEVVAGTVETTAITLWGYHVPRKMA